MSQSSTAVVGDGHYKLLLHVFVLSDLLYGSLLDREEHDPETLELVRLAESLHMQSTELIRNTGRMMMF